MTGHAHHEGPRVGALLTFDQLTDRFTDEAVGAHCAGTLEEQAALVEHQWRRGVRRGLVRGFLLEGPPGVGKTTLAKRLGYELGLRFPQEEGGTGGVVAVLLDGSEIARAKYGESERRIRDIFDAAQNGLGVPGRRTVLIFDDVESILMARDNGQAKEWHFSQDSVFFHAVDDLDTSRVAVVLTTNRPDLVDDAVRDRFLVYRVGYPGPEALAGAMALRLRGQGLSLDDLASLDAGLRTAVGEGTVRSLRDVEHFAMRHYAEQVRRSRAVPAGQ